MSYRTNLLGNDSLIFTVNNIKTKFRHCFTVDDTHLHYTLPSHCYIRFYKMHAILASIPQNNTYAHTPLRTGPNVPEDGHCGPDFPGPNGEEGPCDNSCCSTGGWCGLTKWHCITYLYRDYRRQGIHELQHQAQENYYKLQHSISTVEYQNIKKCHSLRKNICIVG